MRKIRVRIGYGIRGRRALVRHIPNEREKMRNNKFGLFAFPVAPENPEAEGQPCGERRLASHFAAILLLLSPHHPPWLPTKVRSRCV